MKNYYKNLGFTLLELLFTVAIIAILSLATVPIFTSMISKNRLQSTSYQIVSLLRLAREKAIANRINCTVEINPSLDSIQVKQNGVLIEKIWHAPSLVDLTDVSGNPNPYTLTFSARGTTSSRSIHLIIRGTKIAGNPYNPSSNYASGSSNQPKERVKCSTVTVDNVTGRIRLLTYGLNSPWGTSKL